jgi:hypothetical protein
VLTAYENSTRQLIQALGSTVPLIDTATLDQYINTARNQVAGEGTCVVAYPATLAVVGPQQGYAFSSIVLPAGITPGTGPVLNVRQAAYQAGTGQQLVYPRAWPWFKTYWLDQAAPIPGPPREFAQFGQGTNGTLWVTLPDGPYTLNLDVVCLPIPLVDDTTAEAIPELWQDAVPFYAAWLGMQNVQRQADADMMMGRYKELMNRARAFATPEQMPGLYSQGPDLAMQNRYGISPAKGGGG